MGRLRVSFLGKRAKFRIFQSDFGHRHKANFDVDFLLDFLVVAQLDLAD